MELDENKIQQRLKNPQMKKTFHKQYVRDPSNPLRTSGNSVVATAEGEANLEKSRESNANETEVKEETKQTPLGPLRLAVPQQKIKQEQNQNAVSIYDLEIEELEEKPWRAEGADITDYFNYGFNEETWKEYCRKQGQTRYERNMQANIEVLDTKPSMGRGMPLQMGGFPRMPLNMPMGMQMMGGRGGPPMFPPDSQRREGPMGGRGRREDGRREERREEMRRDDGRRDDGRREDRRESREESREERRDRRDSRERERGEERKDSKSSTKDSKSSGESPRKGKADERKRRRSRSKERESRDNRESRDSGRSNRESRETTESKRRRSNEGKDSKRKRSSSPRKRR